MSQSKPERWEVQFPIWPTTGATQDFADFTVAELETEMLESRRRDHEYMADWYRRVTGLHDISTEDALAALRE